MAAATGRTVTDASLVHRAFVDSFVDGYDVLIPSAVQLREEAAHVPQKTSCWRSIKSGVVRFVKRISFISCTPTMCNSALDGLASLVQYAVDIKGTIERGCGVSIATAGDCFFGAMTIYHLGRFCFECKNGSLSLLWNSRSKSVVLAAIAMNIARIFYVCHVVAQLNLSVFAHLSDSVGQIPVLGQVFSISLFRIANIFFFVGLVCTQIDTVSQFLWRYNAPRHPVVRELSEGRFESLLPPRDHREIAFSGFRMLGIGVETAALTLSAIGVVSTFTINMCALAAVGCGIITCFLYKPQPNAYCLA